MESNICNTIIDKEDIKFYKTTDGEAEGVMDRQCHHTIVRQ